MQSNIEAKQNIIMANEITQSKFSDLLDADAVQFSTAGPATTAATSTTKMIAIAIASAAAVALVVTVVTTVSVVATRKLIFIAIKFNLI